MAIAKVMEGGVGLAQPLTIDLIIPVGVDPDDLGMLFQNADLLFQKPRQPKIVGIQEDHKFPFALADPQIPGISRAMVRRVAQN